MKYACSLYDVHNNQQVRYERCNRSIIIKVKVNWQTKRKESHSKIDSTDDFNLINWEFGATLLTYQKILVNQFISFCTWLGNMNNMENNFLDKERCKLYLCKWLVLICVRNGFSVKIKQKAEQKSQECSRIWK